MAKLQDSFNYPLAVEHVYPHVARPPPSNPVLRGAALTACATAVEWVPGIASTLYKLNGWADLRDVEGAKDVDPRYDPTVIPKSNDNDSRLGETQLLTDPSSLRSSQSTGPTVFHSTLDYHNAYKSGKTTPTQVVKTLLSIIQARRGDDAKYANAWIDINIPMVLKAAEDSTRRWAQGQPLGLLDGVPSGVKDEADLQGYYKKAYGSLIPNMTHKSDTTSFCVEKWEEAGAIVIGKLNMHEIGLDTSGCNPNFGSPLNPYAPGYYSGGSSSGSASAVAAGIIPFSLGCDGGGSIRLPSSWCGIYGLKTSHGWVSTRPYDTPATSTSVAGPMAANMIDLEIAWKVMAQPDPKSQASKHFPFPGELDLSNRPKQIGIFSGWLTKSDPEVKSIFDKAVNYFEKELGYEVIPITIPHVDQAQLAHSLTILNEATITMPRSQVEVLSPANRIMLAVGHTADVTDFLFAQRIRGMIMQHLAHLYKTYPGLIIATPTTPNAGWVKHPGDQSVGMSNGNQSIMNMSYVWLANFSGCPALSMPVGYVRPKAGEGQFPIGFMGMGEWGSEEQLIEFGYEGERYLQAKYPGGRVKPVAHVDLLARCAAQS